MQSGAFFRQFSHGQEIGRDLTDSHLSVFYHNGREVGCWREERRSTVGEGQVLGEEDADNARHWCQLAAQTRQGRSR